MSLVRFLPEVLATRCRRIGRTVESCEPAIVSRDGNAVIMDDEHPAYPPPMGLGDYVAAGLGAVGIKPCGGCKERQAALNDLGKAIGIG